MNELNPADIFCKTVKVCMPCYIYPDGNVVTVVDVLHITHAAIATVSGNFCLDLVLNVCVSYAHAFGFEIRSHFLLYDSALKTQLFSLQNKICYFSAIHINCYALQCRSNYTDFLYTAIQVTRLLY